MSVRTNERQSLFIGGHHRELLKDVKRICRITENGKPFVKESSPACLCSVLLLFPVFRYQP